MSYLKKREGGENLRLRRVHLRGAEGERARQDVEHAKREAFKKETAKPQGAANAITIQAESSSQSKSAYRSILSHRDY